MTDIKSTTVIKKEKEKIVVSNIEEEEGSEEEFKSIKELPIIEELIAEVKEIDDSSVKFLVKTGKKTPGKRTKYTSICSSDLPKVIQGKILDNCIIRGANITATRSHDIKLEKYVTQMLDSIKLLLEGKAVEGTLKGAKLVASLLGPGADVIKEIMDKLDGKGSVIEQSKCSKEITVLNDDYRLMFKGLQLAEKETAELREEVKMLKSFFDERLKDHAGRWFSADSRLKVTTDSLFVMEKKIEGIEAIKTEYYMQTSNRLNKLEDSKGKSKTLPKVPISILKRDGHCVAMGCCVVLESKLSIKPYRTTKLTKLGEGRGLVCHNCKGNWVSDEQCYMVAKRGFYKAEVISRAVLCGGGDRLAMIQVELPPEDGEEPIILSFRGSKVTDTTLESEVFSAKTPELLLKVGTRISSAVLVRGPASVSLSPLNTFFSVYALGNQSN